MYTSWEDKINVSTFIIKISIPDHLLEEAEIRNSDGAADSTPKAAWLARHPFTGYLEIDGFGIDKETEFWEVQSNVYTRRNLHCGLKSCEFPGGTFGPNGGIDLHLNGGSESATIEKIKIYTASD